MAINLPFPYPDVSTTTWDAWALLRNLQFLAAKITAIQTGQLMPTGAIVMFRSGTTCPSGYTKVTDASLADRYLRVNLTSGGGTGGSLTTTFSDPGHFHGVTSIVVGVPTSKIVVDANLDGTTLQAASGTHLHVLTGNTVTATTGISGTIAPKYLDVILCQKN